jgi:hypothetical protein
MQTKWKITKPIAFFGWWWWYCSVNSRLHTHKTITLLPPGLFAVVILEIAPRPGWTVILFYASCCSWNDRYSSPCPGFSIQMESHKLFAQIGSDLPNLSLPHSLWWQVWATVQLLVKMGGLMNSLQRLALTVNLSILSSQVGRSHQHLAILNINNE